MIWLLQLNLAQKMKCTVSSLANPNVQERTGKLTFWGFGGQNQCILRLCCIVANKAILAFPVEMGISLADEGEKRSCRIHSINCGLPLKATEQSLSRQNEGKRLATNRHCLFPLSLNTQPAAAKHSVVWAADNLASDNNLPCSQL